MCMTYDGQSSESESLLKQFNYGFVLIFLLECILKIYGLGLYPYLYSGANKFDLFLAVLSIGDFIMDQVDLKSNKALTIAPQIARIFRVLRVTRVFKLIKSFKGLSSLIQTTLLMMPAMLNVLSLIFLLYFILAILFTFLFKDIQSGYVLNSDNVNFKDFGNSFLLMFRMSTGEDWHLIMYDCMAVNSVYSYLFIVYVILIQYIMVNLFILVIMREFDEHFYNTNNPLNQYQEDL